MTAVLKLVKTLGELIDPFKEADLDRFTPAEFKGMTAEQRASITIAKGFQQGIAEVVKLHPELDHVEEIAAYKNSAR